MARPLRIEYQGACYHVMNGGSGRQHVFHGDDYRLFLEKLARSVETFGVSVRAWCLMPRHFHLYLATPEANLSRFMQSFLTAFTMSHNRRRRSPGHLFAGRFKAVLVEDEAYGQQVGRYIQLNPVRVSPWRRAPLARRRKHLRAYPWSSYPGLISVRACPAWLDRDAVLGDWGRSRRTQRRAYAEFVEEGLLRALPSPLADPAEQAVLGSKTFVEWVRGKFLNLTKPARARRERAQARVRASWVSVDDLIARVAEAFDTDRPALLRRWSQNNTGRQVLLYLACRHCRGHHTLTALAERLGGITIGSLTRSRQLMEERLARHRALRRTVTQLERTLRAGKDSHDAH